MNVSSIYVFPATIYSGNNINILLPDISYNPLQRKKILISLKFVLDLLIFYQILQKFLFTISNMYFIRLQYTRKKVFLERASNIILRKCINKQCVQI